VKRKNGSPARTGFSGAQLTGPGVHANAAPAPGTFGVGQADRVAGLIVLTSTTTVANGPGTNLAGVFNVAGKVVKVPFHINGAGA